MHDNICKICGKHFQSRWPSTLCSEACARENSRRWHRTHEIDRKKYAVGNLMRGRKAAKPESIDEKAAEAKALGMTYGQYMAARRFGAVFPGVM